jgi:hypothetical protein
MPSLTPSVVRAGNLDAQSIEFFNGIDPKQPSRIVMIRQRKKKARG